MQKNRKLKFKNRQIHSEPFDLRPLRISDLEAIHKIWANPHVRKYLFDDKILSTRAAETIIKTSIQSFAEYGWGLWAVFLKGNSKMIGFTGYYNFHEPPELQLLYGLLPEYCGKGYATRLAKIMIKFGFEILQFEKIIGSTDAPNKASLKVMENAGMQFLKQVKINGLETVYFQITKDKYFST